MNKVIWFAVLMLLSGRVAAEPPGKMPPPPQHGGSFDESFRHVDTDHDGQLSMVETERNAPGLALRFALIDSNHDGQLSEREIHNFVNAFVAEQRKKSAKRFKGADKDGNGALSKEEAKALPGVFAHYDEMDANHDGQLTLREIGGYAQAQARKRQQERTARDKLQN
ncbi:MAG: calcium sensor EFh [Sideroxydans sp.]|nr:calcium sensor EFh [Sideroxydans sp.]